MTVRRDDASAETNVEEASRLVVAGDRRALARLLTVVERGGPGAARTAAAVHAVTGEAATVGITGAPGAGKSTLTGRLITALRASGSTVAVLAIDPSSPYSGGAILGDRVRMQTHSTDPSVFIRSMATRGHLGGLALATPQAVQLLDAAGFEWVVVETVGVGQVEVEVASHADTTVVVVTPGWGDGVQAAKAGLLEVADVFVVNKADRAGAAETAADLEAMLDLAGEHRDWRPPVVRAVATRDEGTAELLSAVRSHRRYLETSGVGEQRRRDRAAAEIRRLVVERLAGEAAQRCQGEAFDEMVAAVVRRDRDPLSVAVEIAP